VNNNMAEEEQKSTSKVAKTASKLVVIIP